jgi:xanthine dehydrogenase accessory factor
VEVADSDVFIEIMRPSPKLVVVGGVHIAIPLTWMARALGYRTIVVDPRPTFGNVDRFPQADEIVPAWPDEALGRIGMTSETAVAVLTHDPKLDDPALRAALPSPAFYVGALGSKQTQAKRRERLLSAGLTEAQVRRLRAPIGLDLGGRSPEEIAVSVLAQVVAVRNGRRDSTPTA